MIRVKDKTVRVAQLHQSVWHAINQFDALRKSHGITTDTVITSGNDGQHSFASLHHMDRAADLRTNDLEQDVAESIVEQLSQALGRDYDVVLEHVGAKNEHLHIESQPKQR